MTWKESLKFTLFIGAVFLVLVVIIKLGEEKPHMVNVGGKQFIRMTEWNGNQWQVIMLPVDSVKK